MADYISRETALSCFHDWIDRYGHEHSADEMTEYQRIEELPVADAVEVVRCKDCKYYTEGKLLGPTKFCYFYQIGTGLNTADDDFCSKGERREVNHEDTTERRPNLYCQAVGGNILYRRSLARRIVGRVCREDSF